MPIRTKRWNDPVEPDDGFRLLVCAYRPRGVKREGEPWDAWCPELGPSRALHAAVYGKREEAITWDEYQKRYHAEMATRGFFIRGFADRVAKGETLTLLCSSACVDPDRCHRTLLAKLIMRHATPQWSREALCEANEGGRSPPVASRNVRSGRAGEGD